jgi:hypothetical protein
VETALTLFAELGATIWQAKTLILRSDIHQGQGAEALADRDLDQAIELLGTVRNTEAARLRRELERNRGDAVSR